MSSEVREIYEVVGAISEVGVSQRLRIVQVYHVRTARRWDIS